MRIRFEAVILVFAAVTASASSPSSSDELCGPLNAFAESVGPDDVRSIAFHTSWGSNFRNDPEPAIYAKQCVHGDYEPARAVCEYLFEHGAIEFAGGNVERVLTCLAPGTNFGPDLDLTRGRFHVGFGTPDRGSHITVEFQEDQELGGMVLRIEADGY